MYGPEVLCRLRVTIWSKQWVSTSLSRQMKAVQPVPALQLPGLASTMWPKQGTYAHPFLSCHPCAVASFQ